MRRTDKKERKKGEGSQEEMRGRSETRKIDMKKVRKSGTRGKSKKIRGSGKERGEMRQELVKKKRRNETRGIDKEKERGRDKAKRF